MQGLRKTYSHLITENPGLLAESAVQFWVFLGSTSIVGVEKKEIVSSGAGSTLGTAFMCGKTGYVF